MCVLYVSFGFNVRPRTFVVMGSGVLLGPVSGRMEWCYILYLCVL